MIAYVEDIKEVKEYNYLRERVGKEKKNEESLKLSLENTVYSVSAYDYGTIVGYGRIIGDGAMYYYIKNIMVDPDYRHQNIGTTIMEMLMDKIKEYKEEEPNLMVSVGAAPGKEKFYRKFGFKTRQELYLGPQMIYRTFVDESKLYNWEDDISDDELENVIDTLDSGGIVIFPTDTVYGIACNCFNQKAIEKLYEIKERAKYKPINVLTDCYEKIEMVAENINPIERRIIEKYMPGALTIIVKKNEKVPDILTAGLDTIGVRIPDSNIALEILKRVDYPLATTSANISGSPDGIKVEDFLNNFDGKVDIIIDGGTTKLKQSSTIVKVEDNQIDIIRQGTAEISEKI
jgi:L-threonylcarbamoyladenylate synthase